MLCLFNEQFREKVVPISVKGELLSSKVVCLSNKPVRDFRLVKLLWCQYQCSSRVYVMRFGRCNYHWLFAIVTSK